jgi:hypothetical protein
LMMRLHSRTAKDRDVKELSKGPCTDCVHHVQRLSQAFSSFTPRHFSDPEAYILEHLTRVRDHH